MSSATLAELEAVLARPRLRTLFEQAGIDATEFFTKFLELAEIVEPDPTDIPVRDKNDRIFLELAAARPPVEFLITGDRDFERKQYADVPVISAALFVKTILS